MKAHTVLLGIVATILLMPSCSKDDNTEPKIVRDTVYVESGTKVIDLRDGNEYGAVTIGNQTWMAENLNFDKDSTRCYEDIEVNCNIYGRLYTGNAAQNACPDGWHLASREEWETLIDYLGGENVAGKLLLPGGVFGGNEIGFNALPGGRYFSGYKDLGDAAYFVTSTPGGYPDSYAYVKISITGDISFAGASDLIHHNCRCVKDAE